MSEDRYVGTISKHEMVVDRYDYEDESQKARTWDAFGAFLRGVIRQTHKTPDLLKVMDQLLEEEKSKDCEEEDE